MNMLPTLHFRPMRHCDIDAVVAIEKRAYAFGWTRSIFKGCLRDGYSNWLLEDGHKNMIGYGVLLTGAGEAHIMNVCVDPAHQGLGYGKRIVDKLLLGARAYGAACVFLEVRVSNHVAIGLYHAYDFHEIGRRVNYYPAPKGREDAIVMARTHVDSWDQYG